MLPNVTIENRGRKEKGFSFKVVTKPVESSDKVLIISEGTLLNPFAK